MRYYIMDIKEDKLICNNDSNGVETTVLMGAVLKTFWTAGWHVIREKLHYDTTLKNDVMND